MDKVKKMVEAGTSAPFAIKDALAQKDPPLTIVDFAAKYGLPRGTTSETLNLGRRPTEALLQALCAELGGTPAEWRYHLWEWARPSVGAPVLAAASC